MCIGNKFFEVLNLWKCLSPTFIFNWWFRHRIPSWKLFSSQILKVLLYCLLASSVAALSVLKCFDAVPWDSSNFTHCADSGNSCHSFWGIFTESFFFQGFFFLIWLIPSGVPVIQIQISWRPFALLFYFPSLSFSSSLVRVTQLYYHALIHSLNKLLLSLYLYTMFEVLEMRLWKKKNADWSYSLWALLLSVWFLLPNYISKIYLWSLHPILGLGCTVLSLRAFW